MCPGKVHLRSMMCEYKNWMIPEIKKVFEGKIQELTEIKDKY